MTVAGIIPARYASTRFPGKVLVPIHDLPMVHHVYLRACRCGSLDEVFIATDSPLVAKTCVSLGDRVILTSSEHKSGTDRVAEAARSMAADLVVNIQGDEPQLDPGIVDELVAHMRDRPELLMGTVGSTDLTAEDKVEPNVVKVLGRDGQAMGFFRDLPSPLPDKGDLLRHVGLYAYRADFLQQYSAQPTSPGERETHLEQLRAVEMGTSIGLVVANVISRGIDTQEDLMRVVEGWHD